MNIIRNNKEINIFHNIAIVMIWAIAFYSAIIQQKYFQIPYGMLIFGIAILLFYLLAQKDNRFDINDAITKESKVMLLFLGYMLLIGFIVSPDRDSHLSQWFTCLEYLFLQIVIASLVSDSGTESLKTLLLVKALVLAIIFIQAPVDYQGRLSISTTMNPNGLGMEFVTGVWATLYIQQKRRKFPLVIVAILIALFGYCIMLTGSRKALIAMGIIITLWVIFCFLPSLIEKGGYKGIISFAVLVILTFLVGHFFLSNYSNTVIAGRMEELLFETREGERSNMYRAGYEMLRMHPLFGIGFQGFFYNYGSYSHATIVEIPVSGGIIGTLLYFGFYYLSIKKVIFLYKITKGNQMLTYEHRRIKMVILLWTVMLFYTICIIHPYQFESYFLFGIILGDTAYIERIITQKTVIKGPKTIRSKYLKYV